MQLLTSLNPHLPSVNIDQTLHCTPTSSVSLSTSKPLQLYQFFSTMDNLNNNPTEIAADKLEEFNGCWLRAVVSNIILKTACKGVSSLAVKTFTGKIGSACNPSQKGKAIKLYCQTFQDVCSLHWQLWFFKTLLNLQVDGIRVYLEKNPQVFSNKTGTSTDHHYIFG